MCRSFSTELVCQIARPPFAVIVDLHVIGRFSD
jgi:hypothetical protein